MDLSMATKRRMKPEFKASVISCFVPVFIGDFLLHDLASYRQKCFSALRGKALFISFGKINH